MQCNAELNVHWKQTEITLKVYLHKHSWQPPDFQLLINILENTKKCVTLYKWLGIDYLYPWDWMWCFHDPPQLTSTSLELTASLCRRWKTQDLDYLSHLCRQKKKTNKTPMPKKQPKPQKTRMQIRVGKYAQRKSKNIDQNFHLKHWLDPHSGVKPSLTTAHEKNKRGSQIYLWPFKC